MQVTEGSVRVDLVGGTLDLEPINLILKDVVTLNVATTLKAKVILQKSHSNKVHIISKDYDSENIYDLSDFTNEKLYQSDFFGPMTFVCQILALFDLKEGLKLTMSSGAPAGSGLGGSSSMGSTLYKGLCKYFNQNFEIHSAVQKVKGCEARILNQGVPGYQDYYPAIVGGILCLKGEPGKIVLDQLYSEELRDFLESRITLVYSGISRDSGINNWQVYKDFFDKKENTIAALSKIAKISYEAYKAIKEENFEKMIELIGKEGESRKSLCSSIVPNEINMLMDDLKEVFPRIGMKMCGAGGGGCFIITHQKNDNVSSVIEKHNMRILDFKIIRPL